MADLIDRAAALAAVEEVRLESVLAAPLVDRRKVRKALRNVPAVQADDAPAIASADELDAALAGLPDDGAVTLRVQVVLARRMMAGREQLLWALRNAINFAGQTYDRWESDDDLRAGKMLKALAGWLPGYMQEIDAIHAAVKGADDDRC